LEKKAERLAPLAIRVLSIIANTAATERNFSDFGITHTKIRNQLSVEKVHKANVVKRSLRREHAEEGLLPTQKKRHLGPHNNIGASENSGKHEDTTNFVELGNRLIAEAREDDVEHYEAPFTPIVQPAGPVPGPSNINSVPRSQERVYTKIPLQSLFDYSNTPPTPYGGLDFYWHEGEENVGREEEVSDLLHELGSA
jgi:hypothetical protein